MGVGGAASSSIGLRLTSNALTGTAQYGIVGDFTGTSGATLLIASIWGRAATAADAYTVTNLTQLHAAGATKGAGSTITNQHGVYIQDQTQGTNNYGISSLVTSGTNKWNIYASGNAANYFAGNVQFAAGSAAAPALTRFGDDNTGIFFPAADTIAFAEGGAESMRLDSSGNLGLGFTPSPFANGFTSFQIRGTSFYANGLSNLNIATNVAGGVDASGNGGLYAATAAAARYQQILGQHVWFNAPSGTSGNAITFTQAMTLDASGRLGVGTTSPSLPLHIFAGTNNTNVARFTGAQLNRGLTISTYSSDSVNDGGAGFSADFSMRFTTNAIERMRIDSAGNVQTATGAQVVWAPAPASISTTATLTNANIQGQIINTTGTSYTVTMPLGTTLETLVSWVNVDLGYNFTVINTASGTITMAVNTGVTSLGGLTIATGVSAQFRIRRTAANTFILYRLS